MGQVTYDYWHLVFEQAFFGNAQARRVKPPATSRSPKRSDYCGGAGSAWVPDIVDHIDISGPCAIHDHDYDKQSMIDREEADAKLKANIIDTMIRNGSSTAYASLVGSIYYNAVRSAGKRLYLGKGSPR